MAYVYKGTKRSLAHNVLTGYYTVERAAKLARVKPVTVKRWVSLLLHGDL